MQSEIRVEYFGRDPKIKRIVSISQNVAITKVPVLISGEAGLGKRALAKFIHANSNRASKPFQIIDCQKEQDSVEKLILGFRDSAGKFHRGALETSNGGTVVLAHIDHLSEAFQKRLTEILGDLEDYDIDVRIVATTTKNLAKLVSAGRFYRNLFNFLSDTVLPLTPYRERASDIEYIAKEILNTEIAPSGNLRFSEEAIEKMMCHYWTHNFDELRAVIKASSENISGGIIDVDNLALGENRPTEKFDEEDNDGIRLMSLKEAEMLLIKKALIHTSENRTQAAKILGVSIRTLRNKINEYRNGGSSYFTNLR